MVSTLNQKLYLGGLPPGFNMTITNVKPSGPDNGPWRVYFRTRGVRCVKIDETGFRDDFSDEYPITVAKSTLNGLIGTVSFEIQKPFMSPGKGGKVDIAFRIQGTTNVNGYHHNIDQEGHIIVSTSDWYRTERPDNVYITYSFNGTPSNDYTLSVPPTIGGQPADVHFHFVASDDGKQITVSTTEYKDLTNKIVDGALDLIFKGHWKALGWVYKTIFG